MWRVCASCWVQPRFCTARFRPSQVHVHRMQKAALSRNLPQKSHCLVRSFHWSVDKYLLSLILLLKFRGEVIYWIQIDQMSFIHHSTNWSIAAKTCTACYRCKSPWNPSRQQGSACRLWTSNSCPQLDKDQQTVLPSFRGLLLNATIVDVERDAPQTFWTRRNALVLYMFAVHCLIHLSLQLTLTHQPHNTHTHKNTHTEAVSFETNLLEYSPGTYWWLVFNSTELTINQPALIATPNARLEYISSKNQPSCTACKVGVKNRRQRHRYCLYVCSWWFVK